ncbi:protein kinase [Frankia sp. AgB32]|uniref:protein kinase domain-containing protein n=1 Tax=Frankia sp. AgB32 TaxID=631119 RepID=UPI00200F0506|nr:protein kinase [Frankia sp. AgB32]MCK9896861.1 protein kinase [Frankia sp. AgB32]
MIEAILPQYEIGAELGRGGFGLVLAGRHRRLDRSVAIKILVADIAGSDPDRFCTEARILARLDHPHIVRLYEYVESAGLRLIVMEQLAGGTLAARRGIVRSPMVSCAIALAVSEALGCAHAAGVLHRDVKPSNVLLTVDGLPKITDFGIAKLFDGSGGATSSVIGTWTYMAPEQWRAGRLMPATDLYALGAVLYELLTGRPPFPSGQSPEALLRHHLMDIPAAPPGVPAPVAAVVLRALAKKATDRPPTARAFTIELGRAAAAVFGRDWLISNDVRLLLPDDVLDAVRTVGAVPASAAPASAAPAAISQPPSDVGDGPSAVPAPRSAAAPPATQGSSSQPRTQATTSPMPHARRDPLGDPRASWNWLLIGGRHARRLGAVTGTAAAVALGVLLFEALGAGGSAEPAGRPTAAATLRPERTTAAYHGFAVNAGLLGPNDVTVDGAGNLYVTDYDSGRVRRIGPDGRVDSAVGDGTEGYSGDGGPAVHAQLRDADGVGVDAAGDRLILADGGNERVRVVSATGVIGTLAGNGNPAFSGDGAPAINAGLSAPTGVAVDAAGTVYVAEFDTGRIRRITRGGVISTVAGTGQPGFSGDGGPATRAALNGPCGLAIDTAGNLYVADSQNNRIRRISTGGKITTVAGAGVEGFSGDGGPATRALLHGPRRVAAAPDGTLYIADTHNNRIRRINTAGEISTVAGTGKGAYSGDGGPATSATLKMPDGMTVDRAGNLFIADYGNHRIRRIGTNGSISTVAT